MASSDGRPPTRPDIPWEHGRRIRHTAVDNADLETPSGDGRRTHMEPAPIGSLRLLRTNRPFSLLVISRAISFVGTSVGLVALLLQLAGGQSAVAAVTLLLLCGDLLPALLAPLLGVLADRIELRRLMVTCEVGQAAATTIIALWLPAVPILLGLFAVRAILGQIFQPASRAAVPTMVGDEQLPAANAAMGFGEHGIAVLGPLLAALALPVVGISGLLVVDAASFLVSAALLVGLPRMPAQELGLGEEGSFLRHAGRGLREVWRTVGLRVVIISFAVVVAFNGIDDVALVFLATGPLEASPSGTSLLYAGAALGLLLGYAVIGRWPAVFSASVLLTLGYAVNSLGNLLTGLSGVLLAALALQTIRGLGIAAQDVAASTIIQRAVPRALQGRTFSMFYGAVGVAAGVSYLMGGLLLAATGPRVTFVVAGLGGLLAAGVTALVLRAHSRRPPSSGSDA
jgi:MFS family permease